MSFLVFLNLDVLVLFLCLGGFEIWHLAVFGDLVVLMILVVLNLDCGV